MGLEAALFLLLPEELEEVIDVLVQLMALPDLVVLVHLDLTNTSIKTDGVIVRDRLLYLLDLLLGRTPPRLGLLRRRRGRVDLGLADLFGLRGALLGLGLLAFGARFCHLIATLQLY